MKRIHLFEIEDYHWFPKSLRNCMTAYINLMHKLLGSATLFSEVLAKGLKHTNEKQVLDLCSGGAGCILDIKEELASNHGLKDVKLTCSDLYPNKEAAKRLNNNDDDMTGYQLDPLDAMQVRQEGFRTMLCSFHHMNQSTAKAILKNAFDSKKGIAIFEMSDNSIPLWIAWISFPINIIMVLLLTPFVRPMTWQQIVFTYLIPILPLTIAWDGMVSNMRTYTISDMKELTADLQSDDYTWEMNTIKGKAKMLYLMGLPE